MRKATFFLVGEMARAYPTFQALLLRAALKSPLCPTAGLKVKRAADASHSWRRRSPDNRSPALSACSAPDPPGECLWYDCDRSNGCPRTDPLQPKLFNFDHTWQLRCKALAKVSDHVAGLIGRASEESKVVAADLARQPPFNDQRARWRHIARAGTVNASAQAEVP